MLCAVVAAAFLPNPLLARPPVCTLSRPQPSSGKPSPTPPVTLSPLPAAQEGVAAKALQGTPHVVLIDDAFYHDRLKPLLAKWMLLFLASNGVSAGQQQGQVGLAAGAGRRRSMRQQAQVDSGFCSSMSR